MAGIEDQDKQTTTPTSERPRSFFARNSASDAENAGGREAMEEFEEDKGRPTKWSMGVLNDPETHEVPGTLLPDKIPGM